MSWLKPSPPDDAAPHGSADDDDTAISPFMRPRLLGAVFGAPVAGYYPSVAPLDGPHFRVGYQFYNGISETSMQQSENDSTIGMPFRMRPPLIPRRTAGIAGVRNAIDFVASMPYEPWPVVMPRVSRR